MLKFHEVDYIFEMGGGKIIQQSPRKGVYCDYARETIQVIIEQDGSEWRRAFLFEPDKEKFKKNGKVRNCIWKI